MINIKRFAVNMTEENCYIVSDESKEAVIIDDGAFSTGEHQDIDLYIQKEGLKPTHVLCTHGHFDHTLGLAHVYETYGLKPEMQQADAELYINLSLQIKLITGFALDAPTAPLGNPLHEGDTITFGTHQLQVIETPGHTPGGVCFYCKEEDTLFSGDTLFQMSIGRTDFPGGNLESLLGNIQSKLLILPANTTIYPGHGNPTTIETEQKYNPFLNS